MHQFDTVDIHEFLNLIKIPYMDKPTAANKHIKILRIVQFMQMVNSETTSLTATSCFLHVTGYLISQRNTKC